VHLESPRFAMQRPWDMLAGSGRAALVAATGDHFASIASWQRGRACRRFSADVFRSKA